MARTYRGVELRYGLAQRLALTLLVLPLSATTQAEITVDGSLGSFRGSLIGPAFQIDANLGRQVGTNLFHSFGAFNISHPESATFTPNGSLGPIANVLGRVTGGSASTIDGTLRSTIPNANLFFINPHGVAFGPHAQLDVNGSFHVSTADYLRLADGGRFEATHPENSVLTTAPPEAFGFLAENPPGIAIEGSLLQVPKGETLSVVGGDIKIADGSIYAPGGRIDIASVASKGEVVPNAPDLGAASFERLGGIEISHSSSKRPLVGRNEIGNVDVSGEGAGSVHIVGGEFKLVGSEVASVTGNRDGGRIVVEADSLSLSKGAHISNDTIGHGDGGSITVHAKDAVTVAGRSVTQGAGRRGSGGGRAASGIFSDTHGPGEGGRIAINTPILELQDGRISVFTFDEGNGGEIALDVGRLTLKAGSQVGSFARDVGRGGNVRITAQDITIADESNISASSSSERLGRLLRDNPEVGRSGNVIMVVSDTLRLQKGGSITVETAQANAGDITLHVGFLLHLSNESQVNTSVAGGQGDGGNITIDPTFVVLDGSRIVANAVRGRGGNINIVADHLFRTPDSLIEASSKLGIQGTVEIKAPDRDVSAGLLALPAHYVDAAAVLTRPCAERYAADAIRLVVRKYEVLPDSPYALRVYLPSVGSGPNLPSDASQSSDIPDRYAAWDPRTYACAFDLE